jgi:hypothetical protein
VRTTTVRSCHGRVLRHLDDVERELERYSGGRIVSGGVGSWL